ncbi:N-acetylglucosamine-specific PTS transporter subunit IIBC [Entomospira culicis]|uniref:PTS transporter subunit EIIC n=1 Tax=Entomospira culicis TaxID=2719989 RepID=A0A968GGF7_9SPIO|nr:N-acetylglucosamine-specific PTS transporter subunit IIBC [Entomospira culicis]NIZ19638.1 PTS transporter subunit EIIC [Entomospira culicis]NIZ69852.1 PTS transporter subunit EIIC [Entomospira culicis]WDI36959.1 N-acetylglucosamine-specific PTS transporter subunit IIBC [Entomospira culicis]WDI38588.1 N-acetylglucosamine-specific PTS transporter subunit IIBC [Entomospira culicis]
MKDYLQRIGRSLMLPVAALPIAALFMGIGYWIDPNGWGSGNVLSAFLIKGGASILDNLGILFAVGLALGMAKEKEGSSAMAGLVAFLVPMSILNPDAVVMFRGAISEDAVLAFSKVNNGNVFFGMMAGLIAGAMYNRFAHTKLPMALSFFSGRRLVPILTAMVMMVVSAVMMFIWPAVFMALVNFGKAISAMGALGAGLYGFFNRLLIPTGLHHALNNVFWFNLAGINDIGNFWSNVGEKGVTGMYQAGFFPIMMFGLPAGAFAIYQNARPENKKSIASLMLAAGFASFFTGVTEPLEFSFMFVAWPLYVVHAVLTGLSLFVAAAFQWTAGFNFSAGFIDYILSARLPIANQPWMLLVQGVFFAGLYYVAFSFAIRTFNLMTPGREEVSAEQRSVRQGNATTDALAETLYDLLGGAENVRIIDNCATRLRITVKSTRDINADKIKAAGVVGVQVISNESLQIIIGPDVQFIADAMSAIHDK